MTRRRFWLGQLLLAMFFLCGCARVDAGAQHGLAGIALPRGAGVVAKHESSWDRAGWNHDFRSLEPGQTITLLDYRGVGEIRRFWCTIAPRSEPSIHRQAILRMYWDDETSPSVEVPIGDFFGIGFGQQVDFISLPLNQTSGGYNCYWPMPFAKRARWTLTNLSAKRIDAFYYNIDFLAFDRAPRNPMRFHAQWRRENPVAPGQNYTILEAAGRGHLAGVALFMQARRGNALGYLEGDEMIYIDGESHPSIIGTGTEDYLSSGWYFDRGPYSAPYHGCPIKDETLGRISAYRWHIEDPIPFAKSIRVTIEHGHASEWDADYSSVAYWYQGEPHAPLAPLPEDPNDLLASEPLPPMRIEGAIEAESLLSTAKASDGTLIEQEMSMWGTEWSGNKQIYWKPNGEGATLTLNVPAAAAGSYELIGYLTRAPDYATVRLRVGGQFLEPVMDLYESRVVPTGPVSFGVVRLAAGANPLAVQVVGKNQQSTGYIVGIDALVLKPAR